MSAVNPFTKPALTLGEQLQQLKVRGLAVADDHAALQLLKGVGYYRFIGYALHWRLDPEGVKQATFVNGTTLDDVFVAIDFDRKLRGIILQAIERIEVAVRASFTNALATKLGPHWYTKANAFSPAAKHKDILAEIKAQIGHRNAEKREVFVEHYYKTYDDPETPPSWMIFEALSLGCVSKIYNGLSKGNQKEIGLDLNIPRTLLISWLHTITVLRNYCAHHSRLWNRSFPVKPVIPREFNAYFERQIVDRHGKAATEIGDHKLHTQLFIVNYFLNALSLDNPLIECVFDLIEDHPTLNREAMGFPVGWTGYPPSRPRLGAPASDSLGRRRASGRVRRPAG